MTYNAVTHPLPSPILWGAIIVGLLVFVGSFVPAYVMFIFGGLGRWEVAFYLAGPLSFLPASVISESRPRVGGIWFLVSAIACAIIAIRLMANPGGAIDPLASHLQVLLGPLLLIGPFSIPMVVLGVWLLKPTQHDRSARSWITWIITVRTLVVLAIAAGAELTVLAIWGIEKSPATSSNSEAVLLGSSIVLLTTLAGLGFIWIDGLKKWA